MKRKNIVIVGGGYGSISSAALFAKAGHDVTVLEKNAQLGGRIGEVTKDGFRFDTGPSWYLMPEIFEDFYKLFNLDATKELDLIRLQPGYKVFFESDDPIIINGSLKEDARTFESLEKGAEQKLLTYVKNSQRVYDVSVNEILYNNYTSLSWLIRRDVLSSLPRFSTMALRSLDRHVSARFRDSRIKRILEYHSVFLGTSPYKAPAIYSLMSTLDFSSGVYYPRRGMYSLVESMVTLGQKLGVTYKTNAEVVSINVENDVARSVTLQSGEIISADIVITNADLHYAETALLEKKYQSYPAKYWNKKEPSPSAVLISLGIKGSLPELHHHNLFFVDAWRENFEAIYETLTIPKDASLYICKPSATDATAAPEGHENIFILVPLPARKKLSQKEVDGVVSRSIEQLALLAKTPDIASRIVTRHIAHPETFERDFNAWAYNSLGGQSHLLTQSAFFRTGNKSKKVKNLYYVGASTNPGIGLPMCLISAQLVYKRIHNITDHGPLGGIDNWSER